MGRKVYHPLSIRLQPKISISGLLPRIFVSELLPGNIYHRDTTRKCHRATTQKYLLLANYLEICHEATTGNITRELQLNPYREIGDVGELLLNPSYCSLIFPTMTLKSHVVEHLHHT